VKTQRTPTLPGPDFFFFLRFYAFLFLLSILYAQNLPGCCVFRTSNRAAGARRSGRCTYSRSRMDLHDYTLSDSPVVISLFSFRVLPFFTLDIFFWHWEQLNILLRQATLGVFFPTYASVISGPKRVVHARELRIRCACRPSGPR